MALRDIPLGKYSPDYLQDKDMLADEQEIVARVR
jgi:hypothetical protein